jgi:hypothetical protein
MTNQKNKNKDKDKDKESTITDNALSCNDLGPFHQITSILWRNSLQKVLPIGNLP